MPQVPKTIGQAFQACLDIVNGNYDAWKEEQKTKPVDVVELIARIVTDIQVQGSVAEFWP